MAETYLQQPIPFWHVSAHEGHAWNELADVVAKVCAGILVPLTQALIPRPPPWVAELCRSVDWAWAWTHWDRHVGSALPHIRADRMTWSMSSASSQLTAEELIPVQSQWSPVADHSPSFELKILTVNMNSLQGKHRFMEEQFVCEGVQVVCLQETKSRDDFFETFEFYRFATEPEQAWGVAIWIRKWFRCSTGLHRVQRSDIVQLTATPRCLTVVVSLPGCKIFVASMHLPQQGRADREREQVYDTLEKDLTEHSGADIFVIGCDANARVPPDCHPVTGSVRCDQPDAAGWQLVRFLQKHCLFLPTTWHEIHQGESATWKHARSGSSRIDYVAIGGSSGLHHCQSWVDYSMDMLNVNDDHFPLVLKGCFYGDVTADGEYALRRVNYDRLKILSPDGRKLMADALATYEPPEWNVHPDDHALHLQRFLWRVLDEHFTVPASAPRSRYISDVVWSCRQRCVLFKKRTRRFKESYVADLSELAVRQWRDHGTSDIYLACKCAFLKELFGAAIKFATSWAKNRIKQDRRESVRSWLASLQHLPGYKILGALRQFGLGSRRKKKQRAPPPGIKSAQGAWICGRADLDSAWLKFFGDMEAGTILPTTTFLDAAGVRQSTAAEDLTFDLAALPTLFEIEQAFRSMVSGKACGLDLLPPEVFKANPQKLARAYLPLMMKSCLQLVQPLAWTGGVLFELYKGSGAHQLQENHRSIFLASCAGKSLHKILRAKVNDAIGGTLDGLHCGSRKHAPVTLPALAVQLLCRQHKAQNQSFGVFLLDVKCAYYSIVREVAIGGVESDRQVEQLFHRFQLSGMDIATLKEIIRNGGTMVEAGLREHLTAIVRSTYSYTWFVTRHGSHERLCHTVAGSRPGANFADLVFAFIYARILQNLRDAVSAQDAALRVGFSGIRSLWASPGRRHVEEVCVDASWADDTAAVAGNAGPDKMMEDLLFTASTLMDQCCRFGLRPNLKRGKCAMLVAIRGAGSRACRLKHFHGGRATIEVPSSRGDPYTVHVEAQYDHLGTMLDRDGHLEAEARRRLSRAAAAFEGSRKLLLQSRFVHFEDRVSLFRSLVSSTIFNLELWCCHGKAWETFSQGYVAIARRLLAGMCSQEHYVRMGPGEVYFRTGLLPLHILAATKRLGFLCSLARTGNNVTWAIIQTEGAWARQVVDDLRWLCRWCPSSWPDVGPEQWAQWWLIFCERAAWLKQCTKRAARNWAQYEHQRAAARVFLRDCAIYTVGRIASRPCVPSEIRWCCAPCQRTFSTGAGLGAHFKKLHGRQAAYRFYAEGSVCMACGTDFFSTRRLLMHLKVTPKCCDKLAAAGRRRTEAQHGLRWRRSRDDFVLCPPQRVGQPLPVPDGHPTDRKWIDVPDMEVAYQQTLDWLVGYDGDNFAEVHAGI